MGTSVLSACISSHFPCSPDGFVFSPPQLQLAAVDLTEQHISTVKQHVDDHRAVLKELMQKREAAEPQRAAAAAKVLAVQGAMRAAQEQRAKRREAVLAASALKVRLGQGRGG